jgi:hypothetical protein
MLPGSERRRNSGLTPILDQMRRPRKWRLLGPQEEAAVDDNPSVKP